MVSEDFRVVDSKIGVLKILKIDKEQELFNVLIDFDSAPELHRIIFLTLGWDHVDAANTFERLANAYAARSRRKSEEHLEREVLRGADGCWDGENT